MNFDLKKKKGYRKELERQNKILALVTSNFFDHSMCKFHCGCVFVIFEREKE